MADTRGTMSVSGRVAKDQEQLEAERFAKLMRAIAWLEALPSTTLPDVVATQSARAIEELAQIDLHVQVAGPRNRSWAAGPQKIALLVGEHLFVTWSNPKPFSILGITGLQ
jgi:hypothetical protein